MRLPTASRPRLLPGWNIGEQRGRGGRNGGRSFRSLCIDLWLIAGNVSFGIPSNAASDKFSVLPSGLVTLRGPLNREEVSRYSVPILARSSKLLDIATLEVVVMDENDNSPEFRPGSCYTLAVPENQGTAVIHTIAAADLDEGKNGEIYYSIVGKRSRWNIPSVGRSLYRARLQVGTSAANSRWIRRAVCSPCRIWTGSRCRSTR